MEADTVVWFHPTFLSLQQKNKAQLKQWLLFYLFLTADVTCTQAGCRPFFSKRFLSISLGISGRCQITISSFSISYGCRNRDLSALIQKFLKSLLPWVPEALLYTFSFPIFALPWFRSTALRCLSLPKFYSDSLEGSCCQPLGLPAYFSSFSPSQLILTCFTLSQNGR